MVFSMKVNQVKVPLNELNERLRRFRVQMDTDCTDWDYTVLFSKINLYYFTGTMQEGVLLIPRDGEAQFWVRRSYDRAIDESLFPTIKSYESYRDIASTITKLPDTVHIEKEIVPVAMLERFIRYFPFKQILSADLQIGKTRSVKSPYELTLMEASGRIHQRVTEELVPGLLREGINETAFFSDLYSLLIQEGHHGVARFGMFDTES